ncbi:MAG: ABC transporter substrate-binding protein [Corynebacteriales bacterium]|nr:ABC transporter substrate-binding protein [Mycobacteriales bacterium]
MIRKLFVGLSVAALFAASACAFSADADTEERKADGILKVGASPTPHAKILQYVKDELADDAGLKLDIVPFSDYIQPNVALQEKQIDANYFQHEPYLAEQVKERGYKFESVTPVHIEPLAVYAGSADSLADLRDGDTVAIPNDPSNRGRALKLLAAEDIITLKKDAGATADVEDITENPKNLKFSQQEAAFIPRSRQDSALSVINGNYALEAGLNPATDALAVESPKDNPYANVLVVRKGDKDDARVKKLVTLLNSDEVKEFIKKTWPDDTVIPA